MMFFFVLKGEMVNRIEANILSSSDYVVKAVENTGKAVEYKTKARKVCFKALTFTYLSM